MVKNSASRVSEQLNLAGNRLTKGITPINIFYRNEIQYRDDVPTKRKVGM